MTDRYTLDGDRHAADMPSFADAVETPASPLESCAEPPLLQRYKQVRRASEALVAPLSAEDQSAQSMPDASPTKWHLAHTTWFFETFVLIPRGVAAFDPIYGYLFNSYYEALGERQPRPHRGLLTRPSCADVMAYRRHVDLAMAQVLRQTSPDEGLAALMDLGFAHEEQHQELLLMDVQHLFAQSALRPAYRAKTPQTDVAEAVEANFLKFSGGLVKIGDDDGGAFAFDNERPRHTVYLNAYSLADRPVTNGEWLRFMADGGYDRPEFWLSDGWAIAQAEGWRGPLYWERQHAEWRRFNLYGVSAIDPAAPVVHVSFYEADAFARWAGRRLPTEAEWEAASHQAGEAGAFLEDDLLEPRPSGQTAGLSQMFGGVWEWTASPYIGYPGYRPPPGAVGEYNGKFMINQMVLRGGSCLTPRLHLRASYRNFFHPHQRWQASGVRLADD